MKSSIQIAAAALTAVLLVPGCADDGTGVMQLTSSTGSTFTPDW